MKTKRGRPKKLPDDLLQNVSTCVPKAILRCIEAKAKAGSRSRSQQIAMILEEAIQKEVTTLEY